MGARADGAPAHQVADELWRQQVQELGAHRQAQVQHVQQQPARHAQAFVDGEAAVQVRVVDVALPAHRGARLFEVHPHHQQQLGRVFVGQRFQVPRVVQCLVVVVDGAGADDGQQPVVGAVQHAGDGAAAGFHQAFRGGRRGLVFLQQGGGDQRAHGVDAGVVDARGVVGAVAAHGRVSLRSLGGRRRRGDGPACR